MKRKLTFKVGDLVKHRFINYGLGIVIEKRESVSFGEILSSYVVQFPSHDPGPSNPLSHELLPTTMSPI